MIIDILEKLVQTVQTIFKQISDNSRNICLNLIFLEQEKLVDHGHRRRVGLLQLLHLFFKW